MTKRTFVLFFWLAQFAVSLLLGQQKAIACKIDIGTGAFSPFEIQERPGSKDIVLIDDTICQNETIVRADETKWKESLSKLFNRRHSTYRFLTLISQAIPQCEITRPSKVIRESVQLLFVSNGEITLPDYYSFLHRLCPF
ncbi:hypothetical protein ACN9ML_26370 [Dyadobacter endophyticus]|uniref:Uncharacterized protein n=1 Tax=Dyadobacter endophyticus TaxID=1749036 RepID=A0ABQ1YVA4_9BACT|nr:hypothetical protein [Dyadobacter endophyticus]GGH40156.1 hypothetical protein GCM10007423_34990 [Dyadobacter endophyticus]